MVFAPSDLRVASQAFDDGSRIPDEHTAWHDNTPPHLEWHGVPAGARSIAIVVHDPDAPVVTPRGSIGFDHWVVYNIPAAVGELPAGEPAPFTTGPSASGTEGYFGPKPPAGHGEHRYYFYVLALDLEPVLPRGYAMHELLRAVEPHVIGVNRLVGTYSRDPD